MNSGLPCVHDLFAERVPRWPDAPAVVDGAFSLSFAELDRRANRLARHLAGLGAAPETVIGVDLPRSADFVVAVLAVLKSGAAYLPIDPDEPDERRRFIVEDAGVTLTVCAQMFQRDGAAIESGDAPTGRADPANLAYVIYTSGSTGTPKGVMVPHASAANYLAWAAEHYGAPGGAPLHTPLNTDMSLTSLFVPLLTGQPVHVLDAAAPAEALSAAMSERGFGFVKLTPSHLNLLGDALPTAAAASTHRLVVGGEALHHTHLDFWRSDAPDTLIVNEYGPTEATVACCAGEFPAAEPGEGPVPIGTPIAGARLLVLGEDLSPVPDGELGELYVAGPPVSRGYLGRPGPTAAAYLPDPLGDGGRMYRTGDLVRRSPDGRLVYHGRSDDQVKLRGHRIELGEIDAVLGSCPGVHAAAVHVRAAGTDRATIVAHLQPSSHGISTTADEVARFAADRLPKHMVPAEFRWVDALPLSPQGKVERGRLADAEPRPAVAGAGPKTELEQAVAEIVADLLGAEVTDVSAGFFALGGNSLLAARLVARLMRTYQVDLPLSKWLSRPSVEGFAELIDVYRRHGKAAAIALHETPDFGDVALDDEISASLQEVQ